MAMTNAERQREYRVRQALGLISVRIAVKRDAVLPALERINPDIQNCGDDELEDLIARTIEQVLSGLEAPAC